MQVSRCVKKTSSSNKSLDWLVGSPVLQVVLIQGFGVPTLFQVLGDVHAGQVCQDQDPGLQAVGVAERGLLLLHVDVPQVPDQLSHKPPMDSAIFLFFGPTK